MTTQPKEPIDEIRERGVKVWKLFKTAHPDMVSFEDYVTLLAEVKGLRGTLARVEALPERWRYVTTFFLPWFSEEQKAWGRGRNAALKRCADELEQAIKG